MPDPAARSPRSIDVRDPRIGEAEGEGLLTAAGGADRADARRVHVLAVPQHVHRPHRVEGQLAGDLGLGAEDRFGLARDLLAAPAEPEVPKAESTDAEQLGLFG